MARRKLRNAARLKNALWGGRRLPPLTVKQSDWQAHRARVQKRPAHPARRRRRALLSTSTLEAAIAAAASAGESRMPKDG